MSGKYMVQCLANNQPLQERTAEENQKMVRGILKRDEKRRKRIKDAGIDYECPELILINLFCTVGYEQAEFVERELQHMTEQVKSIIQTLNATQGADLDADDGLSPFDVAVRILNNQLRSLMWIDKKTNEFSSRIQKLANHAAALERDSTGRELWLK